MTIVIRRREKSIVSIEKPQNGDGILTFKKILNGVEELDNKGRAFNHCFLEPNSGLGYHKHIGTTETMYILKGKAKYIAENDNETILNPGDTTFTDNGQGHSIYGMSEESLEFIALVLFKGEE